jgi:hypothetical protein
VSLLDLLVEPFGFEFMVRAMAATTIAAVVCAVLSCWLVLIGWSLMGDAVAHSVLPGVVLAYLVGAPFALGALVFGLLAVLLIGLVRDHSRVKEDAAIGIVFTSLFGLGLVLISVVPSQIDLGHIVFGNVLGVSAGDLWQIGILGTIALTLLIVKRRDPTLYAFDADHAHSILYRHLAPCSLGAPAGPARSHGRREPADRRRRARRGPAHHPGGDGAPAHRPHGPDARARAPPGRELLDHRRVRELLPRHRPRRGRRARQRCTVRDGLPARAAARRAVAAAVAPAARHFCGLDIAAPRASRG